MSLSSDLLTNSKLDNGRVTIANTYIYGNDSLYKKIRKPKSQKTKKPKLNLKAIINKYSIVKRNTDEVKNIYDDIIEINDSQDELEVLESELNNLEDNIDEIDEIEVDESEEDYDTIKDNMAGAALLFRKQLQDLKMQEIDKQIDGDIFDNEDEYEQEFLEDYDQDELESDFELEFDDSNILEEFEDGALLSDTNDSEVESFDNIEDDAIPVEDDIEIENDDIEIENDDTGMEEYDSGTEEYESDIEIDDETNNSLDDDLLNLDLSELDDEENIELEYDIDDLVDSIEDEDTNIDDINIDEDVNIEEETTNNVPSTTNTPSATNEDEEDIDSLLDELDLDNEEYDKEPEVATSQPQHEIVNTQQNTTTPEDDLDITDELDDLLSNLDDGDDEEIETQEDIKVEKPVEVKAEPRIEKPVQDSRYDELIAKQKKQEEELEYLKQQLQRTSEIQSLSKEEFEKNKQIASGKKKGSPVHSNIDKYSQLDTNVLYKYVRHFMIQAGVQKHPIDIQMLADKFGSENINKLIRKSYLIKTTKGITIGR